MEILPASRRSSGPLHPSQKNLQGFCCWKKKPKLPDTATSSRHVYVTNTQQRLAFRSHVTMTMRTHGWVPVDSHSTPLLCVARKGDTHTTRRTRQHNKTRQRSLVAKSDRQLRLLALLERSVRTILDRSEWSMVVERGSGAWSRTVAAEPVIPTPQSTSKGASQPRVLLDASSLTSVQTRPS